MDRTTQNKLACARSLGIHHSRIEHIEEIKQGEGEGALVIGFWVTLKFLVMPDGKTFVKCWCPEEIDVDELNERKG